jgi:polyhydroxyalkanoate synthase
MSGGWDARAKGEDATPLHLLLERARQGVRLADGLSRAAGDGIEIATTPKDEIWRDGKVSLHRYRPVVMSRSGPLLILHGLFGRQTITDLEPDRSLVARLLAAGCDTYVLDWGNPSRADRFLDFTDFAEYWLGDAVAAVCAASGAGRVALLGICQGGVFALCHGVLNLWSRNLPEDLIDSVLEERGCLPGAVTGAVFEQLDPLRAATRYGADLLGLADDAAGLATFLRMEAWLADRPDHPAAAARQWLVDLYGRNALVRGCFEIDGAPVDLRALRCPILNIVARDDHIVPPPCARALEGLTGTQDYRLLEVPTGHIGVFVSEKARGVVAPAVLGWLSGLDHGS